MPSRGRDRRGGHFSQRGGTVLEGEIVGHNVSEIVAIERFRRRDFEEWECEKSRDVRCRVAAGPRECAIDVRSVTGVPPHPIVKQRVAGSSIKSENFPSLADPSDIGDPAYVEDCKRFWQRRSESGMEQRSERRALAPGG